MMQQNIFALDGLKKYCKTTRKEVYFEAMDKIILWKEMTDMSIDQLCLRPFI